MNKDINEFLEKKRIESIQRNFGVSSVTINSTISELNNDDDKLRFFNALENETKYISLFNLHKNTFDFFDLDNIVDTNNSILRYINKSEQIMKKFEDLNYISKKKDRLIIKALKEMNILKEDTIFTCYDNYLMHKQLFNETNNFSAQLSDFLDENNETPNFQKIQNFLKFDEFVYKQIKFSKANKLIRSVVSNKYKHLINDESKDLFLNALDSDYLVDNIKQNLGSKIAAIKTPAQFNLYLSDILGFDTEWNQEAVIKKIERSNAEVLLIKDNKIFFDVNTYEQTSSLGSQSWCLTRDQQQLSSYGYQNNERLVFVYDLNQDPNEELSKVALLYKNNKISEIYDKNDNSIEKNNDVFYYYNDVLLPKMSSNTVKDRVSYYQENLFTDNSNSIHLNQNVAISLLKLKDFKTVEKIVSGDLLDEKISYFNLSASSMVDNLDDETFNFFLNPKVINGYFNDNGNFKNYIVFQGIVSHIINENNDVNTNILMNKTAIESFKKMNNNFQEKIPYKTDEFNFLGYENKRFEKIIDVLYDNNIMMSDLIRNTSNPKNITSDNIRSIIKKEPDFVDNLINHNEKTFVIFLLKTKFDKETLNTILNTTNKDYSKFLEKRIQVLKSKSQNDESIKDLEYCSYALDKCKENLINKDKPQNKTRKNKI